MTGVDAAETDVRRPSRLRVAVQAAIALVVVAGIFGWGIPRMTGGSWGDLVGQLGTLGTPQVCLLSVAATVGIATYAPFLAASLPGLGWGHALMANLSSTAVANTVPAGGALGIGVSVGMYASWGFGPGPITRSILVTGFWNLFAKLAVPVLALVFLAARGEASADFVVWAVTGLLVLAGSIGIFVLVLWSDGLARMLGDLAGRFTSAVGRLFRRPPVVGWGEVAVDFRHRSIGLVKASWLRLTLWIVVYNLAMFLLLLLCIRLVGVDQAELSWATVFAGFAFSRLISSVPITPGGVGLVEAGMLGLLTAGLATGLRQEVAAGALLFRALTFVLPVPLGAVSAIVWALGTRRGRQNDETVT